MKNIFKILLLACTLPLVMLSCRDDNFETHQAEPSFKLYNTTLSSNVFYPTMAGNTLRLVWDNMTGNSGEYTVLASLTEDFAKPVTLGKSATNSFTTTIGSLNDVMISAGAVPYQAQKVYLKVTTGTASSNVINFDVTTYPSAKPVISTPAAGTAIVLSNAEPEATATKLTWKDYSYGTDVSYTVELAPKGSDKYVLLGTVNNIAVLNVSHLAMDQAVLKAGGKAGVAAAYDLRVTATTTSTGGTIVKMSDPVTITVTPYQLESYLYVPGAYQDWNPATAQALTSATSNGIYEGYIKFPAAGSEFKFTAARNWDVSYGDSDGDGVLEDNGGNLKAPGAGYYKVTVDMNTKKVTLTPESWGIIGSATPKGWDGDTDMAYDGTTRTWSVTVPLAAGELKFRRNHSWDTNYGDEGPDGHLDAGGKNIAVPEAGTYRIVFDEYNLGYSITKQ